jgi:TFIIF-interacting CTD phosphatase-like protein
MNRPLLILDLDETLVFSVEEPLNRPADFTFGPYHSYKRPHVDAFLSAAFEWFDVAVWTSSGADYARHVVDAVFDRRAPELKFCWSRERCTRRFNPETWQEDPLKDLRKVKRAGYALAQVLIIDDSPEKLSRNYGNHLGVAPFQGDPADVVLRRILPFLEWIRGQQNFRAIEKRGWHLRFP